MDKKARDINNATIAVGSLLILAIAWFYMRPQLPWAILLVVALIFIDVYYNATH